METITLQRDDGPLVADVYASATQDAPTILLLHGWGGSGRYWSATVARLRDTFRVVVPDLPGVGRSLPVRRPHDIFDHVATVEALLNHLAITRVHLVGHSMGGAVALVLAAKRPALVERLVLTASSLFRNETERTLFNAALSVAGLVMQLRAPWMADFPFLVNQSARRYFYEVPDDAPLLRAGFLDYLHMDLDTALASARAAVSPAIPDAARRVQAPTLLVSGREDQVMPVVNVSYTADVIPGCQLRWLERCGHLPMVERPNEYASILREFFKPQVSE